MVVIINQTIIQSIAMKCIWSARFGTRPLISEMPGNFLATSLSQNITFKIVLAIS